MYKILDNLATHGFEGKARVSNVNMTEYGRLILPDGSITDFWIIDCRMLKDGDHNPLWIYIDLIEKTNQKMIDGLKVVCCCEAGQSRSPAIALGVLLRRGYDFYAALDILKERNPTTMIDIGHIVALKHIFGIKPI